jgi:hypothetical protein
MTIERKLISRRLGKLGNSHAKILNLTIVQAFQLIGTIPIFSSESEEVES